MKIIILGAGQVGRSVAANLAGEANDITVVDQNPALLREEHLKKVEDCLQGAVDAARLGGIGYDEVAETLRLLWEG